MSLQQMRIDWLIGREELRPTEKILSVAMIKYADAEGYCWPSLARMASDCSISVRQVTRAVKGLDEKGFIRRLKKGLGRSGANFYRMLFPDDLIRPNSPDRKLPPFYDPREADKTGKNRQGTATCSHGQNVQPQKDILSHGQGQNVTSGRDRMSTGRVTNCPTELKEPDPKDFETSKRKRFKAEGHTTGDSKAIRDLGEQVLSRYRQLCPSLPQADRLSSRRTCRIRMMIGVFPEARSISWWNDYFGRVSRSRFLMEGCPRGWVTDFDWLLKPGTARRVLAGTFDDPNSGALPPGEALAAYVEKTTAFHSKYLAKNRTLPTLGSALEATCWSALAMEGCVQGVVVIRGFSGQPEDLQRPTRPKPEAGPASRPLQGRGPEKHPLLPFRDQACGLLGIQDDSQQPKVRPHAMRKIGATAQVIDGRRNLWQRDFRWNRTRPTWS